MTEKGYFEKIFSKEKDYLHPVYFDIQVLERYFEDPKYLIFYHDYRGSIVIDDNYAEKDAERIEYLKDFGLAYRKSDSLDRAIVVFASDLISLPYKMQSHFHSYYLENQSDYYPNEGFVKNLIYGEWVDTISIYEALTLELHYINEMCVAIGIPKMFLKEFPSDTPLQNERPIDFHALLSPTKKRYYDFILTLEKMIINNLNINTFITSAPTIKAVERKNKNGENKGSLTLLIEWLESNIKLVDIQKEIGLPLKELRKKRQTPAHDNFKNEYDKTLWNEQNEFMIKIYTAVRNIRLIMANHPKSKGIEIPDYLYDGEHIRTY